MLKALRCTIVTVATLSTTFFACPAFAGMVSAPESDVTAEDLCTGQDSAVLREVAAQHGVSPERLAAGMARMTEAERAAFTAHVENLHHAGNITGIALGVAAVIVLGVIFFSEMFWEDSNLTNYNK
jgi:hypothetical protein